MSTAAAPPPQSLPPQRLTAADLEALPNEKEYELVDGQLVERTVGFKSSYFGGEILGRLRDHVRPLGLGWVLPADTGYQCFPDDPNKVRKPDASYIRADRLRAEDMPDGYCHVVPDLVIEVISPNDLCLELSRKVEEYLAAGVLLVWVLDPSEKRVSIYRRTGEGTILSVNDELTGEDVIPDFRCQLSELFASPPGLA